MLIIPAAGRKSKSPLLGRSTRVPITGTSDRYGKGGFGNIPSVMKRIGETIWIISITIQSGIDWRRDRVIGRGLLLVRRSQWDGTRRIGAITSRRRLSTWIGNEMGNENGGCVSESGGCAALIHPTFSKVNNLVPRQSLGRSKTRRNTRTTCRAGCDPPDCLRSKPHLIPTEILI